ncbi:thermonuclease family protein [Microbacterium sp. VKM Ac-2870]|uniref:thermonuclease family protein n=1 Tax=Microbacterium sp. VKM Ac-2870 TaxID=2783825 RepID=UPI001889D266|nr:thermonuclease family protein [Microbacterium sp. VKM Ac-2870]MBF4563415.1 thermonuclease family protein [Microbacterium sp. VKM Ac-2870]
MRAGRLAGVSAAVLVVALTGCTPPESAPAGAEHGRVAAVVDGDTIKVDTATGTVRVRIIGINTPEIGRDGQSSECYAEQARDYLDQLVYGRTVDLSPDPSQADTDKYGRLLRHVYLDGVNVALTEIQAGVGAEYTYDKPYTGQSDYRAAQAAAQAAGRGLWGSCSP